MNASTSLRTVLLIAVASVFATAIEFAGVDHLTAPREPIVRPQAVVQLPVVVVTAQGREQSAAGIEALPRMLIDGRRDRLTATAQPQHSGLEI